MHSRPAAVADPELDDVTLARAQRGDGVAFELLVKRYEGVVWGYLWRMLGRAATRTVVEDLFQETFFGVHRGLARFAPTGPARLSTWILTIATRAVLQRRRSSRGDAPGVVQPEPDDGGEQAQRLERRVLVAALVAALDALVPEQRAVFVLREFHELEYEDIARVLEIEVGTVRSRLHRARESLRKALQEDREMKLNRQTFAGAAVGAALASVTLVTVYEGRVSLASGGEQIEVAAGESGTIRPNEPPELVAALAPDPAVAPAEAAPRPPASLAAPAAREIETLRARLAEKEKELASLRPAAAAATPDKQRNLIDPSPEELLARAQRCEVSYHYPTFDSPAPTKLAERQVRKLGLSETEREAVDEVLRELHSEVPAFLRKLYREMSGDAAAAERLSPSTLFTEILSKAPDGVVVQARARLARERAGLVPPGNSNSGPAAERALRIMVGVSDEFERRLSERLGPARAQSLRGLRESWDNTSSMSGCAGQ